MQTDKSISLELSREDNNLILSSLNRAKEKDQKQEQTFRHLKSTNQERENILLKIKFNSDKTEKPSKYSDNQVRIIANDLYSNSIENEKLTRPTSELIDKIHSQVNPNQHFELAMELSDIEWNQITKNDDKNYPDGYNAENEKSVKNIKSKQPGKQIEF